MIYALLVPVANKIEEFATADSDNVQWTLAQVEVEYFRLERTLTLDDDVTEPDVATIRRRFDVYYSRIQTLKNSSLFAPVRQQDRFQTALASVSGFLDASVPIIDSDDASLIAQRVTLKDALRATRPDVRALSLEGIKGFAIASDQRRSGVSRTLRLMAGIAFGLILVLALAALVLLRLYQDGQAQARSYALTSSRLHSIVSTSLAAILVIDKKGRILDFNGAAEQVFGYTRDEAMGAFMADLIVPDHFHAAHSAGMHRYLTTGEKKVIGKGRVELEAKHKSGRVFPVELSISTAQSEEGEIFVSFLQDISARVQGEKDLRDARDKALAGEKAKAELLAVMSHEMRTPLNGMMGTLELIEETDLSEEQHKYLQNMNISGQLLLHHVNDVLDIARLDSGKLSLVETTFELGTLLQELADSQNRAAQANGNTLTAQLMGDADCYVLSDPMRLRQILLNLIGNAIKFTHDGAITVEAEVLPDKQIELRVADTGTGISEEDAARVFEDFVTLDASYGRQTGGTGLGLGITKRVVDALNGQIGVESAADEGSLFWVRLPLKQVTMSDPSVLREHGPDRRQAKALSVLVIEDNAINRQVVRQMLSSMGHTVTEAEDGQSGVAAAEARAYDLILMDISMPNMDGIEATRHIRAGQGPNVTTQIIALTANALPEDVDRFKLIGMDDVIIKPISRSTLRAVIDRPEDPEQPISDAPQAFDPEVFQELLDMLGPEQTAVIYQDVLTQVGDAIEAMDAANGAASANLADLVHKTSGAVALVGGTSLHGKLKAVEIAFRAGKDQPNGAREIAEGKAELEATLGQLVPS